MWKFSKILILLLYLFLTACKEEYLPKPKGYFRIDLPEKSYNNLEIDCPFTFEYPNYAVVLNKEGEKCWINLSFLRFKCILHISYKEMDKGKELYQFTEDSRNLAYKHTVKASEIDEIVFRDPATKVSGIIYEIGGNTASSLQFFMTDSSQHFLRGSLYFNSAPNIDSLNPVLNFVKQDIQHLIGTINWK